MEYILPKSFYLNTNMNRPIFKDTRHLSVREKCALALAQALEEDHGEIRVHALSTRLMKLSIMCLNDDEPLDDREVVDFWGEE